MITEVCMITVGGMAHDPPHLSHIAINHARPSSPVGRRHQLVLPYSDITGQFPSKIVLMPRKSRIAMKTARLR
jgi:hypothetical protein